MINIFGCDIIVMIIFFCKVEFDIVGIGFILLMNFVVFVGVLYSWISIVYVEFEVEV